MWSTRKLADKAKEALDVPMREMNERMELPYESTYVVKEFIVDPSETA